MRDSNPQGALPEDRLGVLTCPHCGFQRAEPMPADACLFFYECTRCTATLRPLQGECCVFCSYGAEPCPPRQAPSS